MSVFKGRKDSHFLYTYLFKIRGKDAPKLFNNEPREEITLSFAKSTEYFIY